MSPKKDDDDGLDYTSNPSTLRRKGYSSYWKRDRTYRVWAKAPKQKGGNYTLLLEHGVRVLVSEKEFKATYRKWRE